jgi:hypothetical protein
MQDIAARGAGRASPDRSVVLRAPPSRRAFDRLAALSDRAVSLLNGVAFV